MVGPTSYLKLESRQPESVSSCTCPSKALERNQVSFKLQSPMRLHNPAPFFSSVLLNLSIKLDLADNRVL